MSVTLSSSGAEFPRHRKRRASLLITLDLHKHLELAACLSESAEIFGQHRAHVTYLVPPLTFESTTPWRGLFVMCAR